jgi:RimJ/RimL family protein N-acetyltransferase
MEVHSPGLRVYLKQLDLTDAEEFAHQINDPVIARNVSSPGNIIPYPYTKEDALFFIDALKREYASGISVSFGIRAVENNLFVGSAGIGEIDAIKKQCLIVYWLGRQHWRQSYGTETLRLLLAYGFEKLGLIKISAEVDPDNTGSIALLRSLEFEQERFDNIMRFGIKRHDYINPLKIKVDL